MTAIDREPEWVIAAVGRHLSIAGIRAVARRWGFWARPACRESQHARFNAPIGLSADRYWARLR
jgi:hypothetical protein